MKSELRDLPLWALYSDLSQLERRLEIISRKSRLGIEHRRGREYEDRLGRRVREIKRELERRSNGENQKRRRKISGAKS